MSTVDAPAAAPGLPPAPRAAATLPARRFSTRFLRSELWLIFGRRRNWVGLAILATMPIILAVSMKIDPEGESGGGPDFFSLITDNGLFVALAALTIELPFMLPIAVAAISADAVAGEANLGTLRYLLAVPVNRTRMILVKYAATAIFTFAAVALVATVGLLVGLIIFGGGPVTLLTGTQVPFSEGLVRVVGVVLYLGVCLCALAAIGLFASTLTEQPIGAAVAILVISVLSFVLDAIPQVSWLHPYLLTHNWLAFGDLLRTPVAWDTIQTGLISAGLYIVVFVSAAWARFGGRDVTS